MPSGNLSVNANLQGDLEAGLAAVAAASRELGAAEEETAGRLSTASKQILQSKRAQMTATEKVELAIKREMAAGNKQAIALVNLDAKHKLLTRQMRALARAGEAIPPSMTRAAASMRQQMEAARQATAANKGMTLSGSALASMMGVSLSAALFRVVAGMKSIVSNAVTSGDELAKLSQRTGVTVEAIQEFRFAAKSAGVDQAALDKALKLLGKSMGEADAGVKNYKDAFKALGVEIRDGDGKLKAIDAVLMEVADGMKGTESQAEKLMLAQRLMGRSGSDLVNVLQDGSAALEETREAKRRLGLMSSQAAANAEALTQAMTDLSERGVGVSNMFNEDFAPTLTKVIRLAGWFTDKIRENADFLKTGYRVSVGIATFGMSEMLKASVDMASDGLPPLQQELKKVSEGLDEGGEGADGFGRALGRLAGEVKKARDAIVELTLEPITIEIPHKEPIENLNVIGDRFKAYIAERMEAEQSYQNWLAEQQRQRKEWEQEQEAAEQSRIAMTQQLTGTMIQAFAAAQEAAVRANDEGADSFTAFRKTAASQVIAMARTQIGAAAAKAAAEAISAMVGIPIVGPVLGVMAGAAIFAAVNGLLSQVPTAAGGGVLTGGTPGQDSIPFIGMPGEPILPVDLAEDLREVLNRPVGRPRPPRSTGGSSSSAPAAGGGDTHLHLHGVMVADGASVLRAAGKIRGALGKYDRRRPRFD